MNPWKTLRRARAAAGRLVRKVPMDGPVTINEDGMASQHGAPFLEDPTFLKAYAAGHATGSWGDASPRWRAYVATWAASNGIQRPGDFVECGVNRGGLARAIIEMLDPTVWKDRKFFLLDTYQGLVAEQMSADDFAAGRRPGGYSECYEAVCSTFAPYPFVRVVRGVIPESLSEITSERIAFLSIDMNCVPPEIAAATSLWSRLSSGACVVLDDYNYRGYEPQRRAFDAFSAERGVRVLALPTGQGLLFKP